MNVAKKERVLGTNEPIIENKKIIDLSFIDNI